MTDNQTRMLQALFALSLNIITAMLVPAYADPDSSQEAIESFLSEHWPESGIPLQGPHPEGFSPLEASLDPNQCRMCHPDQFRDWEHSRHAQAMGPGVLGQILPMFPDDPEGIRDCQRCHAPLAEQSAQTQDSTGMWRKNPHFDSRLQKQGLVCAACHVRKWQRYGPPRKQQPDKVGRLSQAGPHGGFIASKAFQSSRFCATCHQFGPDGYALNGKPLENTHEEWQQSSYARKGVSCQNCHMPDRRHLWRGIHDPDTVKKGIEIEVNMPERIYQPGETITATIRLKNTGVGHHFPTYVTPRVVIRGFLVNRQGISVPDSLQEAFIGRELSPDLSEEIYDTRIPAGDSLAVQYQYRIPEQNMALKIEVVVEPDHFYEQFFTRLAPKKGSLLEQALLATRSSHYTIFSQTYLLGDGQPVVPSDQKHMPAPSPVSSEAVDWNEGLLTWMDYEKAIARAKESGKPILFILYANWCPICHAYQRIFHDNRIVKASSRVILARANVDQRPDLSRSLDIDGAYVPRTFLLDSGGHIMESAFSKQDSPRHFLQPDDIFGFLRLMNAVK